MKAVGVRRAPKYAVCTYTMAGDAEALLSLACASVWDDFSSRNVGAGC
jgi:hypothetical protein